MAGVWRRGRFHGGELERTPGSVVREGDKIAVYASLPGVELGDIDVSIEDNVLTITASAQSDVERREGEYLMRERRAGSFHRALRLPDTVDTDRIEPGYRNGVLTITIPKAESKKARHLKVEPS